MSLLTLTTEETFIWTGATAGVTGVDETGDKRVIPVIHHLNFLEEIRGRLTVMAVLSLFKGEIYHLG